MLLLLGPSQGACQGGRTMRLSMRPLAGSFSSSFLYSSSASWKLPSASKYRPCCPGGAEKGWKVSIVAGHLCDARACNQMRPKVEWCRGQPTPHREPARTSAVWEALVHALHQAEGALVAAGLHCCDGNLLMYVPHCRSIGSWQDGPGPQQRWDAHGQSIASPTHAHPLPTCGCAC